MLKIKPGFIMRNILDEWIIVPLGAGNSTEAYIMSVNESGHLLWEMLEKGATEDELLQEMLNEYDVSAEIAKNDIDEFLSELIAKGIL